MATFDKVKFAELVQDAEAVPLNREQKIADGARLFDHIIYDVEKIAEIEDVSTDTLLKLAECCSYYLGGVSPWEERLSEQVRKLLNACTVRRVRVL